MAHIFYPLATSHGRICTAMTALVVVLALGGCATMPPPNDAMNLAQARLQDARDADASDYAPVDLGFAQNKFQQAQAAMAERKYADAANLAAESRADAELARAKAQLGAARAQIQAKLKENDRLRKVGEQIDAGAPAQAASATPATPPPAAAIPDMPAPASSTLSTPPAGPRSRGGFQTVPAGQGSGGGFQTVPAPSSSASGQPATNPNQGGQP
ncbi:MAG: DUF4398 domain-containing protein [Rhodanobacter sp.]|nr:MAG: DUF4398 domain-containing protein [Rhodanobacter sp.]